MIVCKRSMDCTCPECAAANAAFSVEDLKQFSSKIDYGDGEQNEDSNAQETKPSSRPLPKPPSRRTRKPRSSPSVLIEESAPAVPAAPTPPAASTLLTGGTDDVDSESGPLDVRLVSKDWKVRKAAYQQVQTLFQQAQSEDSEVFHEYASFLKGMVQDSNASCLDVALDALLAFAENYTKASELTLEVAPGIVAKGLSGRPGTMTRAEEALLKLMEVDTPNVVVSVLLEGLADKKPKVPPACVAILTKALELFGARAMPIKEIKSALPGMFLHKIVGVRQQGLALTAELISWCGEAFKASVVSELRPAQKTDLDNMVAEKTTGSPRVPTRYLRKDRPTASDKAGDTPHNQTPPAAFDPRDLVDAVDILSKLPKTEFNQRLAATKWSEVLEGLNIAVDLIGPVPKLTPGDYGDLVHKIKRLGDHSHVQVASTAHRLLSLLAEGLGSGFQPYCKSVLGAMVIKLKDKKCVAVLGTCLDKVYGNPHSLDQVVDEVVAALDSKKAVHARLAALEWISRCVAKKKPAIETATLVTLARTTVRLVEDSDPKIREAACKTLAAIANACRGTKGPVWTVVMELQSSNARAFKKIRDQVESDSHSSPAGNGNDGGSNTVPAHPVSKGLSASASSQGVSGRGRALSASSDSVASGGKPSGPKSSAARARGPPRGTSGNSGKTPKQRIKPASTSGSTSSGKRKQEQVANEGNDDADESATVTITVEEAMDTLAFAGMEEWEDIISPGLRGTAWKAKVGAIKQIEQATLSDPGQYLTPVVVVFAAHTKHFKDSNFNVLKAAFLGIKSVLEAAHVAAAVKGNQAAVATVLPPAVEKLGDRKLQEATWSLLTSASEALGPSWVSRRVIKAAGGAKAPLVHTEALVFLRSCVEDFGASALPARQVVGFAVSELEHVNPKVRSSALELLGSMYHRLGPPMKALLPDLRAALQSQVDETFSAVGHDPSADSQASRRGPSAEGNGGGPVGGGLPRMDLSALLEKDCLSRMQCTAGKDAWKGRKAAIEEVVQACAKSGKHIEANKFVVEVLKALTPRLADSQSNLKPLAAGALSEVASSVGPDASAKLTRIYAEPLLACVADNRKNMRDAAIAALQKVTTTASGGVVHVPTLEALIGSVVTVLTNTVGRVELLSWLKPLVSHLPAGEGPTSLVSPLLMCMQDKSAGARQLAQECLSGLVRAGTVQPARVRGATRDFQPAVLRSLKPVLDKILESAGNAGNSGSSDAGDVIANNPTPQAVPTPTVVSKLVRTGSSATAPSAHGKHHLSRANSHNKGKAVMESKLEVEGPTDASMSTSDPLLSTNSKTKRLEAEKRSRWFISSDEPRDHQIASLKSLWSPLLRPDACEVLFPAKVGSMECGTLGVELLSCALRDQPTSFMDQLDLILKWVSIRLCEKENVKALGQLLQFLADTFDALVDAKYHLEDLEVDALLPTLLEKSGQAKERFRVAIRGLLSKLPAICSYAKYSPLLLQATSSKNSRTRVACLLELSRCVEEDGPANALGRKGLKELAKHVDSDQAEVRSAALDAVESCYVALGMNASRMHRLLGPVNDKTKSLVDERMKAADRRKPTGDGNRPTDAVLSSTEQPLVASVSAGESPQSVKSVKSSIERFEKVERMAGLDSSASTPLTSSTPVEEVHLELTDDYRASLGGLEAECALGHPRPGSFSLSGGVGEDEGPFRFDCDDLEVKLSPRSREREDSNTASSSALNALVTELENGLLRRRTLLAISHEERTSAVSQIKGLSNWATAEVQRMGGDGIMAEQHSRLMLTLVRCMRLAFTGASPVADDDISYATLPGTGGIDVQLALEVVTALDDVCTTSPRSFDVPSLAAMVSEVCLWLVEQRIGPRASNETYRACDPYSQVQEKLNRVATSSGAASLFVAIAAVLEVMTDVYAKRTKCNDTPDKIPFKRRRSVDNKMLKVYVKLLARILRNYENSFGTNDDSAERAIGGPGLQIVLRSVHKYYTTEHAGDGLELESADEHKTNDAVKGLVSMLCERLCSVFGSSAVLSAADTIRAENENDGVNGETQASSDAWSAVLGRCFVTSKENHAVDSSLGRRHSSPVLANKSDHVAEIARLIGLVSAESQSLHSYSVNDGSADTSKTSDALTELKDYLQRWPEAQATLEDQVHRLKPRFRQFILEGCKKSHPAEAGIRNITSTPLRGRMVDVQNKWSTKRSQELEGARRSLAFDGGDGVAMAEIHAEEGSLQSRNRLEEIRRRMGGLGARKMGIGPEAALPDSRAGVLSSGVHHSDEMADRSQPLRQPNSSSSSTANLQARLRRAQSSHSRQSRPLHQATVEGRGVTESTTSLAERFRRRNG